MDYNNLSVEKFLTSRIPPMLVGKIIGFRDSLDMKEYPTDSNQYTKYFIEKVTAWIKNSTLNNIKNLESFKFTDAILGVSQQIDELHYRYSNKLVIFEGEYAYHWRLNPKILKVTHYSAIPSGSVLVISYPSVKTAGNIPDIDRLLDFCYKNSIDVHIDAAWLGQCKNIDIDLSHSAIKTFSISLSKAFSMGSQRIGVRYSKEQIDGPINIMNNFGYNNVSDMWIGCNMIDRFGSDFWWKNYNKEYTKVCKDFKLEETDSINIASHNGTFVSVRTPLRMLVDNRFDARGYNV
jgi:hypothetical protein